MKVFKFGGASIKDAQSIRNTAHIIQQHSRQPLLVVVSALGKTTNALEHIIKLHSASADYREAFDLLQAQHLAIMQELFYEEHPVFEQVEAIWQEAASCLENIEDNDERYAAFVSAGERCSSQIVQAFMQDAGLAIELIDAREFIVSDSKYREAGVNWNKTYENILPLRTTLETKIIVTQGFIAADEAGKTSTLGREGSDFTAAIFAYCLDAESVVIWKDVPGIMNADPKRIAAASVFEELPYKQAAEMTYYGASVIHPKTIKPVANKKIPLFVKSFENPALPGTIIHDCHLDNWPPVIVFKEDQCLISCKVTDYTFINETQLSKIFQAISASDVRINLMQNSAISFSFCIDFTESKLKKLIDYLQHDFEIYYNTGLQLVTVKHYDEQTYNTYRNKAGVMLEQASRTTLQVLISP